ncbi:MAG: glutamate-5-semialdehyde dehydrogenase [Christensenellaceae bacterium]|nr:glutamate-5-semialdehyde dehydrogenase [Christensenellaceae bacterium]
MENWNRDITEAAVAARTASRELAVLSSKKKNDILLSIAKGLREKKQDILSANRTDISEAEKKGLKTSFIDRLRLDEARLEGIAGAIEQVTALPDPIGEVIGGTTRPNGLVIVKKRVPLGVIGIIYEARPNVTADAIALCLKAGNAVILKGGSDAIMSNTAIAEVAAEYGEKAGLPHGAIYLVRDTSREAAGQLMEMTGYIDVLIPRGGKGLIDSVVRNARVPVIETGAGNCHVYVDKSADVDMAVEIIYNAKTSRPSVCNAAETLLVNRDIADAFMPRMIKRLNTVELRGCEESLRYGIRIRATEDDYYEEYNDLILAVKIVDDVKEAVEHINRYGTHHSDAIVTRDYENARYFKSMVDSACVYVNASTRFTDGGEFGFGAEIGISSQKLHARGPMGLTEITTVKYEIDGSGQVR